MEEKERVDDFEEEENSEIEKVDEDITELQSEELESSLEVDSINDFVENFSEFNSETGENLSEFSAEEKNEEPQNEEVNQENDELKEGPSTVAIQEGTSNVETENNLSEEIEDISQVDLSDTPVIESHYIYEYRVVDTIEEYLDLFKEKYAVDLLVLSNEKLYPKLFKLCKKKIKENPEYIYVCIHLIIKNKMPFLSFNDAKKFLKKAKDKNHPYFYYFQGELIRLTLDKKRENTLKQLYEKSIDLGLIEGYIALSHCYRIGFGVEEDEITSYQNMAIAAKNGHPYAMMTIARFKYFGYGCASNIEESFSSLKELIDNKYEIATFDYCYVGLHIEEKDVKDEELFQMLQNGHAKKLYKCDLGLGICYLFSKGTKRNYRLAKKLLIKSVDEGYYDGCYYIGVMKFNGQGSRKSYEVAFDIFNLGKKFGSFLCKNVIDERYTIKKNGKGKVKKEAKTLIKE